MGTAFAQETYVEGSRLQKPAAFLFIALVGAAAGACSIVLALANDAIGSDVGEPLVIAVLSVWVTMSYVLCGLLAWWRRPESRFGPLMIAAGFANFLSSLSWATNDRRVHVRTDARPPAAGPLPARVPRLSERAPAAGASSGGSSPLRTRPRSSLAARSHVARRLRPGQPARGRPERRRSAGGHARPAHARSARSASPGSASWSTGRRRAGRPLRRSLALLVDSFALALVMIAALFIFGRLGRPRGAADPLGDLRGPRPRPDRVPGRPSRRAPRPLLRRRPLRRAARRSGARRPARRPRAGAPRPVADARVLAARVRELRRPRRPAGRAARAAATRRATTLIERDGAQVAALLHDPALHDEPELLAAVTAAAGIALENARLHAELRARLEELRGSRARIIEAGQKERQRLERNLHDGAQQRLIALSLELGAARGAARRTTRRRARASTRRRREIATSLEELRDVARGLHPAVVSGHGLAVALEQLAARAPVPVRLDVELDGRLPEPLEVAAYYLVSESLANVGKHAQATSATVDVSARRRPGRRRGRRRRRRRRRHRARLGPARARRPRRGARRPAAGLEPDGRRHAGASGDPVRVVIAEDSVLLREGLARLLSENGFEVVGSCDNADELLLKVRELRARRRHRRHPAAADPQRRGPARGARDPRRPPVGRRARALAVRRGRPGDEAARRLRRGRRLPAQGPHQRRQRVRRRRAARRGRRLGDRPDHRLDAALAGAGATTRSPS